MADFDDPFHNFMEECLESKNLRGQSQRTVQQELKKCVEAWNDVVQSEGVQDVDEEELARDHLLRSI